MFAQDLSVYVWHPTLLMRGEIRSIRRRRIDLISSFFIAPVKRELGIHHDNPNLDKWTWVVRAAFTPLQGGCRQSRLYRQDLLFVNIKTMIIF